MRRGILSTIDWALLAPVLILVIISLTTLFSINPSLFKSQFIFFLISLLAYFFFSHANVSVLKSYAVPIYSISFLFLLMILVLGIESRGAVRWLEIAGFRVQFSEIIKPFLGLSFASFLITHKKNLKTIILVFSLFLPIGFLIFKQPDLGNALIYFFVCVLTLILFGFPWRFFAAGGLAFLALFPLMNKFLHGYQKERLATFLHPSNDPLGTSYNAIQSIIAVGSGNFFGKGLGQGTQSTLRFLPERHTDFIFATITEGLGILGGFVILLAFAFFLFRMYTIFFRSQDLFSKVFSLIAFSLILVQFFINVGMNVGMLPIVGVTLPFVSYGGSSLLSNFILLGFLSAVSKEGSRTDVLEIR